MEDFDAARKQRADGFIIGGERFSLRQPSFADVAEYQDGTPKETQTESNAETLAFIEKFIQPDDLERWRALVARKDGDPLTLGDILGLSRWLMEQHTERPTILPSSSGRGQVRIATGSGAGSRSQAAS